MQSKDLILFPVFTIVKENVTITRELGVLAASQLLDLQLEVETISPQKLAVLFSQRVIGAGGIDLLALHQVHHLEHLQTDLVDQTLGILGQQHDLLEIQSVAETSDRFP